MTASDHIPTTRDPAADNRVARDKESWQRFDLGRRGRHTGREYFDQGTSSPSDNGAGTTRGTNRTALPWDGVRTLSRLGIVIAVAGAAGWLWLLLDLVGSVGAGTEPEDAFSTRLAGIPLGSGGLVAIVVGILMIITGNVLAKAIQRRQERVRWDPSRSLR